MKRSANIGNRIIPYLVGLALITIWEVWVRVGGVPAYILPTPTQIIRTLADIFPLLMGHTLVTMEEAALGFGLALIIGFIVAYILNQSYWLNQALYPFLVMSQTIPIIIIAPLFLIWFGWGMLPKVIVVVLVCFFPVVISLLDGLNSVDPDLISLFRSMGASRTSIFRMVKLPAAMPYLFSGLRISATYSIMAAVIGEWLGAQKGLGYFMTIAQKSFRVDRTLAAVVIVAGLSLLMVKFIDWGEWLLIPWNRQQNQEDEFNTL